MWNWRTVDSHCAVRLFRGMPPLVSSTGQTASRSHQANHSWLVSSFQTAVVLNHRFVRKQQKVTHAGWKYAEKRKELSARPPTFSCSDVSTCTFTVESHEGSIRRWCQLVSQRVQQVTVKGFHLLGIEICNIRVSSVLNENGDFTQQLFGSCWPIMNKWLLDSFLDAICCWREVAYDFFLYSVYIVIGVFICPTAAAWRCAIQ